MLGFSRESVHVSLPQLTAATIASLLIVAASQPVAQVALPPCNGGGRIVNLGTLALSDCIISGNSTTDAGGGVNNTGMMTLTRVVVTGNHSDQGGGGIYNGVGGTMTLVDVIVMNNSAGTVGGGIHNDGGTLYMSNTTVSDNTAGTGGGGIANTNSLGSVIGTAIAVTGNATTTGNGGGVYNYLAQTCFAEGAPDISACRDNPTGGNSLISGNTASAGRGGGVANDGGAISLADSTIDGNHARIASAAGGDGGGIYNVGTDATTRLFRVTLSNNTADGNGGGVFNDSGFVCCSASGDVYATNVTMSGNSATGAGGALFAINGAVTRLRSATIADNSAAAGAGGVNVDANSTMELKDTLLARNGIANCTGNITSGGNNLDTGDTCAFTAAGDVSNVDDANVALDALAANGGPTQGSGAISAAMKTQALASTSPAVDTGSASCPATDQRGLARPHDGGSTPGCDIGAFELLQVPPPIIDTYPPNPTNSTFPTFTFHDTTPAVMFVCSMDAGLIVLPNCPSPVSFPNLGEGSHTFAVMAVSSKDGGTSSPATYTWTIDTTPPNTTIDSGPANPTNSTAATFAFHSNEAGSTFQCSLDSVTFVPCSSGQTYSSLGNGAHYFQVLATDPAGNTGLTTAGWTIDTISPDTTITSGPPAQTGSTAATLTFYSETGATFQCSLDGGAFVSCSSAQNQCQLNSTSVICVQTYSSLGGGTHSFQVRATDTVGNTDPTPFTWNWFIDTVPPDTTILSGPANPSNSPSPTFVFGSEPGATFQCSLDGVPFFSCNSAELFGPLTNGPHSLQVRAVDPVGNTDPTPATYTWTIDTTPPNTTIDSGPANPTTSTTATFAFHSDELGSTFQCSLDGGAFLPCSSGQTYGPLGNGSHSFQVRAIDIAGSADPTPATNNWSITGTSSYEQLASIGASLAPYASNPNIKKAIDSVNKALAPKYWADGNNLTKSGQSVFSFAYDAVENLLGVTSPPDVASAAQSAIASLVAVCRNIAAAAIQYAIDHGGDSREITAAQKDMTAAQSDLTKGRPDSAIAHYANAWLHAWKSVN